MMTDAEPTPNTPAVFSFEDHTIDVIVEDGEPWFIGRQVCDILGLKRQALYRLDDDQRGVRSTDTPGGSQEIVTVNESGLYSLIFRSRKPETQRFRSWVTREVLPTIRRTGYYSATAAAAAAAPEHLMLREERLAARERRLQRQSRSAAILRAVAGARDLGVDPRALHILEIRAAEIESGENLNSLRLPAPLGSDGKPWQSPTQMAARLGVSPYRIGVALSALGYRGDKDRSLAILNTTPGGNRTVTTYLYRDDVFDRVRALLAEEGHLPGGGGQ